MYVLKGKKPEELRYSLSAISLFLVKTHSSEGIIMQV